MLSSWAPACPDVTPGGHAGVGVVGLHCAPLSIPTFATPSFSEFFLLRQAMRVVLRLGKAEIDNVFIVYGHQGLKVILRSLRLQISCVPPCSVKIKMCCSGQPLILVGDLHPDPLVTPSLAKGISDGFWIDLESACASGKVIAPAPTCQFQPACPNACAASTSCSSPLDRWFPLPSLSSRCPRWLHGTLK